MKIVNIKIYDGAEWVAYELGAADNSVITNNFVAIDGTGVGQPYYSTDVGIIAVDESSAEKQIKPNTYFFDETSAKAFCDSFGFKNKIINLTFENPQFGQHSGIKYFLYQPSTYALAFLPNEDIVGTYNMETLAFTMDGGFISPYIVINEPQLPSVPGGVPEQGPELAALLKSTLFPDLEMEESICGYALPAFIGDDIASKKLKFGKGQVVKNADGSIESFEFLEGQAKTIAAIDDNIANGSLIAWDANKGKLVATELDLNLNIENGEGVGSIKSSNLNDDDRSYTEEELPIASGHESIAFGKKAKATGKRSVAIGNTAISSGNTSVSIGQNTTASNNVAVALGYNTKATAERSMAVNDYTEANGARSFAANWKTKANGDNSAAFGVRNTADGDADFITGIDNYSNAYAGFVAGRNNNATRNGVFVAGQGNKAELRQNQAIFGEYNLNKDNTLLEVGNGNLDTDRSNAFEVLKDGRAKVYGAPIDANDVVRKADLSNLEKLVAGLTDAQITALNNFAKSLTVTEEA